MPIDREESDTTALIDGVWRQTECTLSGDILNPCWMLEKLACDGDAVEFLEIVNIETHQATRKYTSVKSGEYRKRGIVFNYCPFCGKPNRVLEG